VKDNQALQARLNRVTNVEIKRDVNDWDWDMLIATSEKLYSSSELIYEFKELELDGKNRGCFVGSTKDGAIISCVMHSGSDKNEGGFGGAEMALKMKDGTLRTIRGGWSGRPGVHRLFGSGEYLMAVNQTEYNTRIGLSWDFVNALLAKFNLPFEARVVPFLSDGEEHLQLVAK